MTEDRRPRRSPKKEQALKDLLRSSILALDAAKALGNKNSHECAITLYLSVVNVAIYCVAGYRSNRSLARLDSAFDEAGLVDRGLRLRGGRIGVFAFVSYVRFTNKEHTQWEVLS